MKRTKSYDEDQDEVEERMAGMKEDRRYGSQRCIACSDQQYERIRQGDGKQPSPFFYPVRTRKGGEKK